MGAYNVMTSDNTTNVDSIVIKQHLESNQLTNQGMKIKMPKRQ